MTTKALSDLVHYVRSHIYVSAQTGNAEADAESGERSRQDPAETVDETPSKSPAWKAKDEFRWSLQKVFSESNNVEKIMLIIEEWKDEM